MAGMKYGLTAKLHANELSYSGGIQAGVKYNALSVDHLEYTGDEEINSPSRFRYYANTASGFSFLPRNA